MVEFVGRFLNKVDKKGRVSVPAAWRSSLIFEEFSGIVAQLSEEKYAIDGYSRKYLNTLQTWLDKDDPLLERHEFEATLLFGGSMLNFDQEGRVVLPESYRTEIQLNGEALFVGMGRRFRIWEPIAFKEYLNRASEHMRHRRLNTNLYKVED